MIPLQIVSVMALLAGGALVAGGFILRRRARIDLEHHVNLVADRSLSEVKADASQTVAGRSSWIDEPTRRLFCAGISRRWGMRTGAFLLLPVAVASAIVVWILGYWIFGSSLWLASALSGLAFFLVPRLLLSREQRRADRQFMELFPNAIDMMIRMLRAGLPITSAARSIGVEAPPPFNAVFELIANQVEIGVPFERALDSVSQRIGLPDFRFFSVAVTLQHATGGNLANTLEILSDIVRKRRAIRLKAIAATGEVRVSAYVLGAIPIVTIGLLLLMQPDYVAPLFYDIRGKYILGAAVGLLVLAFLTMKQMMRGVTALAK